MNSKAIRKQLLAAVAMVLVAAVALGSSTYAWFVASGSVNAEGMYVQAQSEGGLAIRWTGLASQIWGTSASAGMTEAAAASLKPTSTYDLRHWSHATAEAANNSAAKDGSYTNVTTAVLGAQKDTYQQNNGYVLMQPFEIRSTSEDRPAQGLFVSNVTVTNASHDLDASLRVGVRLVPKTDGAAEVVHIYAPVANATKDYQWTADGVTMEDVTISEYGTKTNGNSTIIASGTEIPAVEGDAIDVEIYIWYEGEDAKLYSDNFIASALHVNVEFSSYGFAGQATGTNKVDLTTGITVTDQATTAKAPGTDTDTSYYLISGKTGAGGVALYSSTASSVTSASTIVTISGGKATVYRNVILPA